MIQRENKAWRRRDLYTWFDNHHECGHEKLYKLCESFGNRDQVLIEMEVMSVIDGDMRENTEKTRGIVEKQILLTSEDTPFSLA